MQYIYICVAWVQRRMRASIGVEAVADDAWSGRAGVVIWEEFRGGGCGGQKGCDDCCVAFSVSGNLHGNPRTDLADALSSALSSTSVHRTSA